MKAETNSLAKFGILDIPDGWQIKKLKDVLIEGRLGGNYENAEANNGIPVIKMGNLGRATIKIDKIQYLPENEIYNDEDVLVKGDLLFNTRNTLDLVGKVAIWNNELPFAVYNSNLMRMKFDTSFVESTWFMNRAFNSYYGLRQLRGIATGTTSVAAIYGRDLESIKFLLPPLPEQNAIAKVLSTADAAIHTTEKLIAQKELRKKWLMQQLLTGKKRLKGFGEEWKRMMLGDIGEIKTSSVDKVFLEEERIVNLVNYMDVYKNRFITPEFECKKTSANEREINTFNLRKGDILFTPSSETPDDIGHSAVVTADLENTVYSYHLVRFRLFEETTLSYNFRAYVFNNQNILNEFSRRATGSTRFTISKSDFEEIETKIPPTLEEQTAIAQVLQAADKEISLLKAKAEKLREQKKGLMQVLLTGKVRLNTNNLK